MSESPFSTRRFLIIFTISWLVLICDHALLLYWFDITLKEAIYDSLISNITLLGICLLIMNTVRYYLPGREHFLNLMIMCLVLTGFWLALDRWLLDITLGHSAFYESFLDRSLIIRFSIGVLVVGIVTMVAINWHSWYEQKETDRRKTDAEKMARDAELYKLRQQLQPHFLFNSLNSINALIGSRPAEARKMVQQLSDFLRGTIRKEETQWVTLQEELQYLQLYLEIEKVRFGNRLSTQISIADDTLPLKLPALLLQPVVENAIKFGLYDTVGETIIEIKSHTEDRELVVGIVTMVAINWHSWYEQKETDRRKTDAEKMARDAELYKLRQQLQPHFLFNSLNSINALIGSRPAEARKMVQQLSDFLRGTIRKEETQWVSLQEELQYLQLYLEIEKVRFGNRLSTQITIAEDTLGLKLPALLLQPVVENAIKFGLYDTVGETIIEIKSHTEDRELVVEVTNPFDPETSSPQKGTGFGLKSVQRRLFLLFARADLLKTEFSGEVFTTRVRVPQPALAKEGSGDKNSTQNLQT